MILISKISILSLCILLVSCGVDDYGPQYTDTDTGSTDDVLYHPDDIHRDSSNDTESEHVSTDTGMVNDTTLPISNGTSMEDSETESYNDTGTDNRTTDDFIDTDTTSDGSEDTGMGTDTWLPDTNIYNDTDTDSNINTDTDSNSDTNTEANTDSESETDTVPVDTGSDTETDTQINECEIDWDCELSSVTPYDLILQYNCINNQCVLKPLCPDYGTIKCISINSASNCADEELNTYRCEGKGLVCCNY